MGEPTSRDDFVGGKVEAAINEAIGDILPGAHVTVAQYYKPGDVWEFHLALPPLPAFEVPAHAHLEEIIETAERTVRAAKVQLLVALGVDDYEAETTTPTTPNGRPRMEDPL